MQHNENAYEMLCTLFHAVNLSKNNAKLARPGRYTYNFKGVGITFIISYPIIYCRLQSGTSLKNEKTPPIFPWEWFHFVSIPYIP